MYGSHVDCGRIGLRVGPRHQLVDAGLGPAVDELRQSVGEPGVRIDAVELRGLDQRGDGCPVGAALVAAGEQRVLAVQCNLAFILPISGKLSSSNIVGTRFTVAKCGAF